MEKEALTSKEKEIINLGISIASGCQPCTKYHIKKCREEKVSEYELVDFVEQTELIHKKSIDILKRNTLSDLDLKQNSEIEWNLKCENKSEILIGLSVSYTLNNTDLFEFYITKANQSNIRISDISFIMKTSKFIFDKARTHVEILSDNHGTKNDDYEKDNGDCGCGC